MHPHPCPLAGEGDEVSHCEFYFIDKQWISQLMSLNLSVPAPAQQANIPVETRVDQVSSWLGQLSSGYVAETASEMYKALAALNRYPMDAASRMELLEAYRAAIDNLLPAMKTQFVIVPLPLPEKNRRVAELNRQLYVELGYGYKIVLLESIKHPSALTVQRAISSLGQVLAICYETYAPAPAGVWSEIHQLYRFAAQHGLLDKSVEEGALTVSAGFSYKQALLLAVADPYHLMQGEVIRILDYIGRFAQLTQLQTEAQIGDAGGLFLVRLDSDAPPKVLPKTLNRVDGETAVLFNTLGLAAQLSQQLGGLEAGIFPIDLLLPDAAREQPYRNLMRRLLKHWGVSAKRHFNRKHYHASVDICVGIRAIHYFLYGEQVYGAATGHSNEVALGEGELDFSPATHGKNAQFSSSQWNIVNESAGGMALTQVSNIPPQLRAGEIVGLRAAGSLQWHIAVVRWVKSDETNRLDLGIQLIAPSATAVAIKPAVGSANQPFTTALLLPEIPLLKQPPCVVVPRGGYQAQHEFLMEQGGGAVTAFKAEKLVESTVVFERFQFSLG
ncbi:MAG: hypothetical protein WC091_18440 [Sulfuricellaceae bacterium]